MANWSENARKLLYKRYLARNEQGETIESPDGMIRRVVDNITIAQHEVIKDDVVFDWKIDYFKIIDALDFLPNSPTLMNAGRPLQQLSACFAWKVPDSLEGIFSSIRDMAVVQKSGGGTGFWFGDIREKGTLITSTNHMQASGPVAYMPLFDDATEVVQQGGMRRGASIAVLPVWHPDIEEFIKMKHEEGVMPNFNISVAVDNKFMAAVHSGSSYDLISPVTGDAVTRVSATDIWDLICDSIWKNGEPGILFWDTIQKEANEIGIPIIGVNPCGEQILPNYGSCNLGSINLAHYKDDEWLRHVTKVAVRFLNGVIDANKLPLPEIEKTTKKYRQIGLGVMGWADFLFRAEVKYGSDESFRLADNIMAIIYNVADKESIDLVSHYGSRSGCGRANATITTIAPTGSISILAGCSSSIEPIFDAKYASYVLPDKNYEEASDKGELTKIERDYSRYVGKDWFVTTKGVLPLEHVKMQATFQRWVDSAVSKTINMLEDASVDHVKLAIKEAHKSKCKGLTIYRDNSRKVQVLRSGPKTLNEMRKEEGLAPIEDNKVFIDKTRGANKTVDVVTNKEPTEKGKIRGMKRPKVLDGKTHKIQTGCGSLYVVINRDESGIREVFLRGGKSGGCSSTFLETAGRLITLALRANVDIKSVAKQLKYCRCPVPSLQHKTFSCMDAVGKLLEGQTGEIIELNGDENCPACGDKLRPASGCWECPSCGYSKC